MKNKRNTYLLLIVVLGVWGLIIYKMIHTLYPKKENTEHKIAESDFSPQPIKKQDTFSISLHKRDPFLGGFVSPQKRSTPKKTSRATVKKEELPEVSIRFSGLIADKTSKQKMFFITINNKQYLMKPGDEIQGVRLLKGNGKTIRIRYNNHIKTIPITS